MENKIILTGTRNVPDRYSRTGWNAVRYYRQVENLADAKDGEEVFSGRMQWIAADPEGRWDAGWGIPGRGRPLFNDREHAVKIHLLEKEIQESRLSIELAEKGHPSQQWDDRAQDWVTVTQAATDKEVQAGLAALDVLPGLEKRLEQLLVLDVDGRKDAAELASIRKGRADKEVASSKASKAGCDLSAAPETVRDLARCLETLAKADWKIKSKPDLSSGVVYFYTTLGRNKKISVADIRPYADVIGRLARKVGLDDLADAMEGE